MKLTILHLVNQTCTSGIHNLRAPANIVKRTVMLFYAQLIMIDMDKITNSSTSRLDHASRYRWIILQM